MVVATDPMVPMPKDPNLRDAACDDTRMDNAKAIRKEDMGGMIDSSLFLFSEATRDRNPGGTLLPPPKAPRG